MKMLTFARRNAREILRDPLTVAFSLGFPLVVLGLLTAIQANIPVSLFEIGSLAPGITVFGLSFMTLFSATLISKDRNSALLQRLYTTPMTGLDFILGYLFPIIPIAMAQGAVCFLAAVILGLPMSASILWCILLLAPVSLLYIGLGLLCGAVLNEKQAGGLCGALLTNVSAWLSGIWFDVKMVGGVFETIADVLPFLHAVELERAALAGDFAAVWPHLLVVLAYALGVTALAVWIFLRQIRRQ